MLQGYIPYKEIFDLKGPFLWFLQMMGQMIYPDKVGMFVLQTIFFEIYLFLSFYCAKLFMESGKALLVVLFELFFWGWLIEGGNTVEELTAVWTMLVIFLTCRFIKSHEDTCCPWYAFAAGICFAVVALTRIIDSVTICACVLFIALSLLHKKQFKNLACCMGCFFIGTLLVVIPFAVYYWQNDAFKEMLYGWIGFSITYTQSNRNYANIYHLFTIIAPICIFNIYMEEKIGRKGGCAIATVDDNLYSHYSALYDYRTTLFEILCDGDSGRVCRFAHFDAEKMEIS